MTAQSKTTIKSYFQTGDKPTEAQFIDLIDSYQDANASAANFQSIIIAPISAAAQTINGNIPTLQILGTAAATSNQAIVRYQNTASSNSEIDLCKTRGTSIGVNTAVQAGDSLGSFAGCGADGTNIVKSGDLIFIVDAGVTTGIVPGRAILRTANSAGTLINGLLIDSIQNVWTANGTIGPSSSAQHILPAVAGDTIVLVSASQQLNNKTIDNSTIGSVTPRSGAFTTVSAQAVAILGASNGATVLTQAVNNTGNDVTISRTMWRVAVIDATTTALATIPTTSNTTSTIEARVGARRTGGSSGSTGDGAAYHLEATYKNVNGILTLINSITVLHSAESNNAWDCTFAVSADTINLNITGAANNNTTWWGIVDYFGVN